jgi:hypothetical protein
MLRISNFGLLLIAIVTLGLISTAVLSQETDQNWRLIYRPMAAKQGEAGGGSPFCFTQEQIKIALRIFYPNSGWVISPDGMEIIVNPDLQPDAVLTFSQNGCLSGGKVLR